MDPVLLSPQTFHVLLALADQECHGYRIIQRVEEQTRGRIRLGPGTLYGALKRLLGAGLVVESGQRPDPELDDERRRYYRLTPAGRRLLRAEAERLAEDVALARRKHLLPRHA